MPDSPDQRPTASILLVDDQPLNLVALEAVLEPLGQRIVRATTGEEALAYMKEEEFAVVLLDVLMPGIDGLVTADRARKGARERGNEVPIILMTAGDGLACLPTSWAMPCPVAMHAADRNSVVAMIRNALISSVLSPF